MDVRREKIYFLWNTVNEHWPKGFSSKIGNVEYLYFCRRTKLPGRGIHSEKVRETGRRRVREEAINHFF